MIGATLARTEDRQNEELDEKLPPRSTRLAPLPGPVGSVTAPAVYGPYQSAHHSQTLPIVSCRPSGFAAFVATALVMLPLLAEYHATFVSVPKSAVVVPPRHAYSHSASVGSRMPVSEQKLWAFSQLMRSTGLFGRFGKLLGLLPITPCHCACVTSVRPM